MVAFRLSFGDGLQFPLGWGLLTFMLLFSWVTIIEQTTLRATPSGAESFTIIIVKSLNATQTSMSEIGRRSMNRITKVSSHDRAKLSMQEKQQSTCEECMYEFRGDGEYLERSW